MRQTDGNMKNIILPYSYDTVVASEVYFRPVHLDKQYTHLYQYNKNTGHGLTPDLDSRPTLDLQRSCTLVNVSVAHIPLTSSNHPHSGYHGMDNTWLRVLDGLLFTQENTR